MFECFHCLERAVIWQCDYMASEMGYEEEGIVHCLHCANCGADIEYFVPMNAEGDDERA